MLKNLKAFAQKPQRTAPKGYNKGSRYEDQAVMIVKSVKNSICIPKGVSQQLMGFNAETDKVSLEVIPHFIDAELTMSDLRAVNAKLADDMVAAGAVKTGEELIAALESGEIQKLLPAEIKEELISTLAPTEEYPIMSIIYKKEGEVEITPEQYKALSKEEKEEYTYRKDATCAKLTGIVGKDGSFSAAAAYNELGGMCNAFADEACTVVTEEVGKGIEAYTKQLGFGLSEQINLGGMDVFIAYRVEDLDFTSKSKKGQERKANKSKVEDAETVTETVEDTNEAVAESTQPVVEDTKQDNAEPVMDTKSDDFQI